MVQDTLLKLYLADPDRVRENLKAWLYAVCRNRAFDVLRKEHRLTFTDDDATLDWLDEWQPDPSDDASREEMLEHVWRTIEQLPANQKEVIRLKFQHGLSYKEISASTGLSVTNVGFILHTGIKRLRKLMSRTLAEPDILLFDPIMNPQDHDHPDLTAYALGELSPADAERRPPMADAVA